MEENKDYQSSMEYSYGGGNATVQAPVKENVFLGADSLVTFRHCAVWLWEYVPCAAIRCLEKQ